MPALARRMPAEWEPHEATWLGWPHAEDTWPGVLAAAQAEFTAIVETIAAHERVELLVTDAAHERAAGAFLAPLVRGGRVRLHMVPTDDVWLRDTGPTFVREESGTLAAVDWGFNAWGGKYPPWDRDDAVAARIAELAGVPRLRAKLVCEGGALETDGAGTLIATASTLLCPRRNPGRDREGIEAQLAELLGIRRVIWLDEGIEGDDTDGHIDDVARFVAPGRVVCAVEPEASSANHAPLRACRRKLAEAHDAQGRRLEVIDLPMPPRRLADGEPLPASYANFYVANQAVLVPVFDAPSDAEAVSVLEAAFPDRKVIGMPSRALIRGLGAVHCLTQQQPVAGCP